MNKLIEVNFVANSTDTALATLGAGFVTKSMSSNEVADVQEKCIVLAAKFIKCIPADKISPIQIIRLYAKVKGNCIIDAELTYVSELRALKVKRIRSEVPVVNEYEVLRSLHGLMLEVVNGE